MWRNISNTRDYGEIKLMFPLFRNLKCDVCGGNYPIYDDANDILPTLHCIRCLIKKLVGKIK